MARATRPIGRLHMGRASARPIEWPATRLACLRLCVCELLISSFNKKVCVRVLYAIKLSQIGIWALIADSPADWLSNG